MDSLVSEEFMFEIHGLGETVRRQQHEVSRFKSVLRRMTLEMRVDSERKSPACIGPCLNLMSDGFAADWLRMTCGGDRCGMVACIENANTAVNKSSSLSPETLARSLAFWATPSVKVANSVLKSSTSQ